MTAPTITVLDTGWLRQQERVLVDGGGRHDIEIPVPSWLVRHPRGVVVFDVGLHPSLADGPAALGPLAKFFTPRLDADGSIGPRLEAWDVDPAGPHTVVLSHCHFDHAGGLRDLANSRVIVQRAEWEAACGGADPGYDPALYDLGHDIVEVEGAHDVFGDGSVTCIPTPGHTCGHQSLQVVTDDGPVILAADACYFTRTLDDGILPPFGFDLDMQRVSLAMVAATRAAGTRVVPGHDADVVRSWKSGLDSV